MNTTRTTEPDALRRSSMREMKTVALLLLLVMVGLYVLAATHRVEHPQLAWLQAFAEAAMVGAVADWFAVTALFRRPLGLPIPHTGVIPRNRERIAESIGEFVQSNFLSEEILPRKVVEFDPASRLAAWLSSEEAAAGVSARLAEFAPKLLSALDDPDLRPFLDQSVLDAMQALPLGPSIAALLDVLMRGGDHQRLFEEALRGLEHMLEHYKDPLRRSIEEEIPWYVPRFLHHRVFERLMRRVHLKLEEINSDPAHPMRAEFDGRVRRFITELRADSELSRRVEALKHSMVSSDAVRSSARSLTDSLARSLSSAAADRDSLLHQTLARSIGALGRSLAARAELRAKINERLADATRGFALRYRSYLAAMVSETVQAWDTATVVEKVELQIGRDLQYIRINGTLVGGCIGLLIHLLSTVLSL